MLEAPESFWWRHTRPIFRADWFDEARSFRIRSDLADKNLQVTIHSIGAYFCVQREGTGYDKIMCKKTTPGIQFVSMWFW